MIDRNLSAPLLALFLVLLAVSRRAVWRWEGDERHRDGDRISPASRGRQPPAGQARTGGPRRRGAHGSRR